MRDHAQKQIIMKETSIKTSQQGEQTKRSGGGLAEVNINIFCSVRKRQRKIKYESGSKHLPHRLTTYQQNDVFGMETARYPKSRCDTFIYFHKI